MWRLLCTPSHMHSQPEATFPSRLLSPPPFPTPCEETQPGWKRSLEFLAGKLFSLQQVNSCPFFLLSFSPGVGKECCHSLLAGFLQALSSGAQIWDLGDVRLPCLFLFVSPVSEAAGGFLWPIQCIIVYTHLLVM